MLGRLGLSDHKPCASRAPVILVRERAERSRAVAHKGGPVHQRQRAWRELGEAADGRAHVRVERGILEQVLRHDRRSDHVALRQRRAVA